MCFGVFSMNNQSLLTPQGYCKGMGTAAFGVWLQSMDRVNRSSDPGKQECDNIQAAGRRQQGTNSAVFRFPDSPHVTTPQGRLFLLFVLTSW